MDEPWPKLDPLALYGLAGEVVETIGPQTEADPAAILASVLTSFGSSVGPAPHVRVGRTQHPARLNVIVVGKSSRSRKGTSWSDARAVFAMADKGWTSHRVLSGLSSGEGLIGAVADPSPDKQGNLVGGVSDKRLMVVEQEYSRVLTVKGRDGNTLSAVVRDAYDHGDLRVMTKIPQIATGAHISILGHITIVELRRALTELDRANGYGNRHLFVCARRSANLLPNGGNLDDSVLHDLGRKLTKALEAGRKLGRVFRTEAAEGHWADTYKSLAVEEEAEDLAAALCSRAEAHITRLALDYALLDGSKRIEVPHQLAAEAFWSYCADSVRHVFGDALGDEIAEILLEELRRAGDKGLSGRDQYALFGRHITAQRLDVARADLINRGLAEEVSDETDGRPRTVLRALRTANKGEQSP